jgi:hypothetical protein
MVERTAVVAKLGIKAHAHMLAMLVATSLRMTNTTPERYKRISDIGTFSTPRGTLRWRRIGSKVFGEIRRAKKEWQRRFGGAMR